MNKEMNNPMGGALSAYRPKPHPYCAESNWREYQGVAGPVTYCKIYGRIGDSVTGSKANYNAWLAFKESRNV